MTTRTLSRAAVAGRTLTIDLYCRISRDYDGTLRKVEAQEAEGRAAVLAMGHNVGTVYQDPFLSGWNRKVVRPFWDELMVRLESGASDGVWVRDLDRFTRKLSEALRLLDAADKGAVVIAGHSAYDLTTARGRRNFMDDAVDAEDESNRISERTTRGKKAKAHRGLSNASRRAFASPGYLPNPKGWDPSDPNTPRVLVPPQQLEAEREAVRELARLLLAGANWVTMCKALNATGLRSSQGNEWCIQSIKGMLKRPGLAGIGAYQGHEVGTLPGDPVLDRETWERVQSVMASRRTGRPISARYLLSNIIICAQCGNGLTGRPVKARKPYPDGEVARSYQCLRQPGPRSGCGRNFIDQRYADSVVEGAVKTRLGDPRHVDRLAARFAEAQAARSEIEAEARELRESKESLASKVIEWGVGPVDAAMKPLTARLAVLKDQLDALEGTEGEPVGLRDINAEWGDPKDDSPATIQRRRGLIRKAFPGGITIEPATGRGPNAQTKDRFRWTA